MSAHNSEGGEEQVVACQLSNELFAISIERINTIIRMQPITRVPGCGDYVEGVTNLRGSILPVIDLRKKFSLPMRDVTRASRIVVVEAHGQTVGLMVDAVTETVRLSAADIEPPSGTIARAQASCVWGIGKAGDKLLVLLDLDRLLSRRELAEAVAAAVSAGEEPLQPAA